MTWIYLVLGVVVGVGLAELILRKRKSTGTMRTRRNKSVWQRVKEGCCLEEG